MTRQTSSGWSLEVDHPDTSRTLKPEVLDSPAFIPSLNSLPQVRIPIRKSDVWLDPSLNADPVMRVWLDGQRQPIDELREVEDQEDRVVLHGVGGTELRQRVQAEYREEERHVAARDLVTGETGYAEDVDTPSFTTNEGETLQTVSTTSEFDGQLTIADTEPVLTSGDELKLAQTSFFTEGEDYVEQSGTVTDTGVSNTSEDSFVRMGNTGDFLRWEFTTDHTIPTPELTAYVRLQFEDASEKPGITVSVDGTDIFGPTGIDWTNQGEGQWDWDQFSGDELSDLSPGTHNLRIDLSSDTTNTKDIFIDVVAPTDDRYNYTFDDTVDGDNHLSGPELYPDAVEVEGSDATTAFSIIAGEASLTIDDTTGSQRLQISNDRGSTWLPSDGTEDNTSNVSADFSSQSTTIRLRTRLSRYGSRTSQSPTSGFNTQIVSDWTLQADIQFQTLLIDQKFDDLLINILNDIAANRYVWSVNLDNAGNYQVSWARRGARVASDDPDIVDVAIQKTIETYDKITIKGSNRRITDEDFTGSTSFVDLARSELVPGEESVYDGSGTTFDRGDDYEMDYSGGRIRITDSGAMSVSTTYTIDYSIEIAGSYPDVSSPDREFVREVPGVVRERGAQQIAFALFDGEAEDPLYSGDLTLPRSDPSFDPLDALNLDNLDLPAEATPLEPNGEPQLTPAGIQLRLGSRTPLEDSLQTISETVSQISRRS